MSITGKILFGNNISPIVSGEDINLIVEIKSEEELFIKDIFLNFFGAVNVEWEDLINKSKDGKIIYIMQKFNSQQILVYKHIIVQNMDAIVKGYYYYNVLLNIPHHLPQSDEKKYGSIKYELELGVNYKAGVKILCNIPLDIKGYLNICHYKEYMQPFHTVFEKSLCLGICNFQPLKIILTVPNTLFIPGDSIDYFVKIEHFSKFLDLQRLSIILVQTQHYKAYKPKEISKKVYTTLSQTMHLFNENHHNSKLKGSLKIPQYLVPTSTIPCLLSTSYNIHVILVFIGFHTDGYISLPIVIGSHGEVTKKIDEFKNYEATLQIEHNQRPEYVV